MKNFITPVLLLAGLFTISSCKKDDAPAATNTVSISGTLSGASVLPTPIMTDGTGTVTGTLDKGTNELTYSVTYAGLSGPLVAGHFHIGVPPSNVGSIHAVSFATLTSPITGKQVLTAEGREALLTGNMYVNLHTQANKDGEVRANVMVK